MIERKMHKITIALFVIIQFWFIYIVFSYPVIGIDVKKTEDHEWVISYFERRNKAEELGIRVGDVVIQVDNKDPNEYFSFQKWRMIEQAETILLSRDGKQFLVSTEGIKHSSPYDVLALSGEIISFLLAAILYRKLSNSRSAVYLTLVFSTIGVTFMSLVASIRGDALGKHLVSTFLILLPVIFLHFLIVFLKEKGNIHLQFNYIKFLYAIVLVSFTARFVYYTVPEWVYIVYRIDRMLSLTVFILVLFVNLFLLFGLYIKFRKEKSFASTIIKTIWISLLISFTPLACFSFIPMLLFNMIYADPFYMGWFVLFFPLSFAYLIMTRQLYDIDIILRRILFTIMISAIPSAVMVGITYALAPEELTPVRMLIEFILFVLILSYILYSLEYFTTKLEPTMFPRKYHLQKALRKIAGDLGAISSFRQLKDIFLVDIVNSIQVFGGAIVFKYKDSVEIISEGSIDENEVRRMVQAEEGELGNDAYSVFEINRHEEFTSYLIMTQKKTNTRLGMEETQWLSLIVTYLSVCLENIHLVRKLTKQLQQWAAQIPDERSAGDFIWFRKLMFELQEKERVRIATDLHDTTMQDLFFLKDRLQTILEKYSFRQADMTYIQGLIDYIDIINSNLRQSCFELHPYLLKEIGLVPTIEKLVRFERAVSPFNIQFYSVQSGLIENTDLETKRHLFRIVQELINNAKKHSQAAQIRILMRATLTHIIFEYEDDGVGYEEIQPIPIPEIGSSGIGMAQMKNRILFLNGQYELETSKGNGYKFKATFPLKEGQTA